MVVVYWHEWQSVVRAACFFCSGSTSAVLFHDTNSPSGKTFIGNDNGNAGHCPGVHWLHLSV